MQSRNNQKGFTLAELLIVVAIIGVLTGVAIPVFSGRLDRAKEATCTANRRSLYGQVVVEHMLSNRPYQEVFDELVGGAGKCPSGGVFSWQDQGDTGKVLCSYHDGGGSGEGAGSTPVSLATANAADNFHEGTVIQDASGTVVIKQAMWNTRNAYIGGASAAELAAQYPSDAILVDASDIKDYMSETLATGDICYYPPGNIYYLVGRVSQYESRPNDSWTELLK